MEKAKYHKKHWTAEQDEFLLESYGMAGIQFLMDRLGKSQQAIEKRMRYLTGSHDVRLAVGSFSTREVAEVLGVDHKMIRIWIDTKKFPAKQFFKKRNDDRKTRHFHIEAEPMWKWVAKNKDVIPFIRVQRGIILPEPDWLEDEIKKAFENPIDKHKRWTKEEEEAAIFLRNGGMSYEEIGKQLRRTARSVWARLNKTAKKRLKEKKNIVTT